MCATAPGLRIPCTVRSRSLEQAGTTSITSSAEANAPVGLETHESWPARRHGAQLEYDPQGITKQVGGRFGFVRRLTKGDVGPFNKVI